MPTRRASACLRVRSPELASRWLLLCVRAATATQMELREGVTMRDAFACGVWSAQLLTLHPRRATASLAEAPRVLNRQERRRGMSTTSYRHPPHLRCERHSQHTRSRTHTRVTTHYLVATLYGRSNPRNLKRWSRGLHGALRAAHEKLQGSPLRPACRFHQWSSVSPIRAMHEKTLSPSILRAPA